MADERSPAAVQESAYARIAALTDDLQKPLDEHSQRLHDELVALIEAGRHIVIGAKAAMFYTRPRFTADTYYAVGKREFANVRHWLRRHQVPHLFNGEAVQCPHLRLDVVDGSKNPVMDLILRKHNGMPPLEAVAALKYVAAISPARPYERRLQDATDLAALVRLPGFDSSKFEGALVGDYLAEVGRARKVVADMQAGKPVAL